jgi:hypothetical protein
VKQTMFPAEDGTTFHGGMKQGDDGLFEVWCYAQRAGGMQAETKHYYKMGCSEEDAIAWLGQQAISRGFSEWHRD